MTTGQYANLLLRKLQVYFSCSDTGYRAYLYNFFGSIFNDPSVKLTERTTQCFIDLMDDEIDYAARKNLYTLESLYNSDRFDRTWLALQNSFSSIGVNMTYESDGDGPTNIMFELPSGKILNWVCRQYNSYVRVNSQLRVTDPYREQIRTYYMLDGVKDDLNESGTNVAGLGTKWEFDEDSGELTISGEGTLAGTKLWNELGFLDKIKTVIVGAGVNHLTAYSIANGSSDRIPVGANLVFLHGAADPVRLDAIVGIQTLTPIYNYTIYTDNNDILNYDWPGTATITYHPLSEW